MEIYNWIKKDLDNLIDNFRADMNLIASKKRDDEWKRDHYRYTFTIFAQRIYNLLNTSITANPPAAIQPSTRKELEVLKKVIEDMIDAEQKKSDE
jgi:hypothetical protein